ncbi:MAG: DUF1501 domain-containing protein [Acidobacteriia bacterium]|nr:DUF1501 domain-containing protein [Terriglobia bacterium]MBV8903171.1 DUF1501 domain-containing protein [Terriglobia bacterium]
MKQSRRDLLRWGACGLLGRAAFISGFDRFSLISAMAAENPSTYRALVCIFMFGGNDSNNTVVSVDNYATYAAKRGNLALAQSSLLPISPASGGNYGLHTNMTQLQALFNKTQSPLAIVCNVGTLVQPVNKQQYLKGTSNPYQLFSHSDQQSQWQTSISNYDAPSGWGGRMADNTQDSSTGFPTICSLAGVSVFSVGSTTQPIALAPAPTALNQTLQLAKTDTAIPQILTGDRITGTPALVDASANIVQFALNNAALLNTNPTIQTAFPNTGLGNQLLQVAKLISVSASLGLKRQIFFCSIGGFDTHVDQLPTQVILLQQVSDAMAAFYRATVELGVSSAVTTFTLSDFSRTFVPAGTDVTTIGSDHAWGSHHFVMGDSVKGGTFYGAFPDLVVGGNQDTDTGSGARGRWIPTISVDEYAATLATWYGLSVTELLTVFPNITNFKTSNLGFMSA